MADKKYRIRYLPLFEQDLVQTVSYITNVLKNPDAAEKLANDVEAAILERLHNPLAFENIRIIGFMCVIMWFITLLWEI